MEFCLLDPVSLVSELKGEDLLSKMNGACRWASLSSCLGEGADL